jgi:hypothetical protein
MKKYLFLSLLFGIFTTLSTYRGFGISDHIEQLPLIYRMLDSAYLKNDFFTNVASNELARRYYTIIIATLAGSPERLPSLFFVLTLVSNIAIAIITFLFARKIFFNSDKAGIYASALVMTVSTFYLGWSSAIYKTLLTPSAIATPFIFLAIYLALNGNILKSISANSVAIFFHPLFGLEMGALILAISLMQDLSNRRNIRTALLKKYFIAAFIFVALASIFIFPQLSQQRINANAFIYIVAFFRHPHHYAPSTFGARQYIIAGSFLIALLLMWNRWRKDSSDRHLTIFILAFIFCILLLAVGGYVFVELIPFRIWTEAQSFRLLYILKWFGLIFIGGTIARLSPGKEIWQPLYWVSALHPLTIGMTELSMTIRQAIKQKYSKIAKLFEPSMFSILVAAILILRSPTLSAKMTILLAVYLSLIRLVDFFSLKILLAGLTVFASALGLVILLFSQVQMPDQVATAQYYLMGDLSGEIKPVIDADGQDIADFAHRNTSAESVFLVPPNWGQFRLLANRAIIIDFKAFPFTDQGIWEWYQRILRCYGRPKSLGFKMLPELQSHYSNITDEQLRSLQHQYGFDYVVLPSNTPTEFNVIYQNRQYKIINPSYHN